MLRREELLSNYIHFLEILSNMPEINVDGEIDGDQEKARILGLDGLENYASSIRAITDYVDRENKLSGLSIKDDNCCYAVISASTVGYLSFSDMDFFKKKIHDLYALLSTRKDLTITKPEVRDGVLIPGKVLYGDARAVLHNLDKAISERQKQYVEEMLLQPISEAQELAQSLGAPVIVESLQFVREVVGAVAHDLVKKDDFYAEVQSLNLESLCGNIREVADEFSYVTTSPGEKLSLIKKFEKQWCVDKKDNADVTARSYGFMLRQGITKLIAAIKDFFSEHDEQKKPKAVKKETAAASLQNGLFHFSEKCKKEAEADLESRLNLVAPVQ